MAGAQPVRIAVDIGGTFTDLQILDSRQGRVVAWKTPTTPADPSEGLLTGVREAADRFGFALADVGLLLHGTTIATNAVLERKLARGRAADHRGLRGRAGDHAPLPARHLRPRPRSLPLPDRARCAPRRAGTHAGRRNGGAAAARGRGAGPGRTAADVAVEAVAVCLLHSYANPAHERRLKALIAEAMPDLRCRCRAR
jgi:N-methylhydantoinase A